MDGQVERMPHIHRDYPRKRTLTISRQQTGELTEAHAHDLADTLAKLQANHPETILGFDHPVYDREKGRLAVGATVYGSQRDLQERAWGWADMLGGNPLERRWAIYH